MGRLRTRNLRAKRRHLAQAKERSAKRWTILVKGLDQFSAKMRELSDHLRRATVAGFYGGARIPVFPALPHRPFLTPALEESMVNVREEMNRAVREALARGQTVNITMDGKVTSTFRP